MENLYFSKETLTKLNKYRSEIWGIDFFFEFWSRCSKKEEFKAKNFNNEEFQQFLDKELILLILYKSKLFKQISDVCYDIYCHQLDLKDEFKLRKLSDSVAMDLSYYLFDNIVKDNFISKIKVLEDFYTRFDNDSSRIFLPDRIFEVLEEKKILVYSDDYISYKDVSFSDYSWIMSYQVMSILKKNSNDEYYRMDQKTLNILLDDLISKKKFLELIPKSFEKLQEYNIFIDLIKDFSDPQQYFEFKDLQMNNYFRIINKYKLLEIDRFFQCLLVFSLKGVYFSLDEYKSNNLYRQILKKKNEGETTETNTNSIFK